MKKSTASSIGAVLLLCCTGLTCVYAEYCDKIRVKADQTQCFTDLGISVAIFNTKRVLWNYSNVCRYQGAYKAAVSCAFDVSKRCLSEMGEGNEIVSEAEQVMQILSSLCSHANGHAFTTLATPMMTGPFVPVMPRLRRDTCSDSSMGDSVQMCFRKENITISLSTVGSEASKQSALDSLLSNEKTQQTMCRSGELERYQRAAGCAVDVARQCVNAEYRDLLMSSAAAKSVISETCSHLDDINHSCVIQKASALYDCGFRLGKTLKTPNDVKTLMCTIYKFNVVCQKEVLPPCGCKTTSLYVKLSKEYLNPPGCPRITEGTPVCEAGTDRFISMGAQSLFPGFSVAALLLTACLSVKLVI